MFYSQTYLGRKGPLGTVWCAAHLQHRLKKSHYTSTNIPKTVDYIMYSELPIALRMSGHLLLGVVRIYSKQVDFLFRDCNFVLSGLRKAFASVKLNFSENALQAPVQSITLPATFELDALVVGEMYHDWDQDNHSSSHEDITLLDQLPTGQDPYIAISFDEDMLNLSQSVSIQGRNSNFTMIEEAGVVDSVPEIEPMRDVVPEIEVMDDMVPRTGAVIDVVAEVEEMHNMVPEVELMRHATPGIEVLRDTALDLDLETAIHDPAPPSGMDIDLTLKEDQNPEENEAPFPSMKHTSASSEIFSPLKQHSALPCSDDVQEAASSFVADAAFELASPDLAIRPSPPVELHQERKRKRKPLFDECVVLKNCFIKKALDDRRDIIRERKSIPSSSLGLWNLNKRSRKERIFEEPITTGLGGGVLPIFENKSASVQAKSFPYQEVIALQINDPTVAAVPSDGASDHASNFDIEIEQLRHAKGQIGRNDYPEFLNIPSMEDNPSVRREELSSMSVNTRFKSEIPYERPEEESVMSTILYPSALTGTFRSLTGSPQTFLAEDLGVENTSLPDIPELGTAKGLEFLEADNESPGTLEDGEVGSLPVRTRCETLYRFDLVDSELPLQGSKALPMIAWNRGPMTENSFSRAVAQFLKGCSPLTSSTPEEHNDLSLNKILEGRRRKVCARMFLETLVLKSYGLIDMQQDEPYADIKLKLTRTLSKVNI